MLVLEVSAAFDPEANVWYVRKSNVPGLATEAETQEDLFRKVLAIFPVR